MPCLPRVRLCVMLMLVMLTPADACGPHAVSVAWHYQSLASISEFQGHG